MLSISHSASDPSERSKCSPNVLPCRIHHNGPVNANKRYWDPKGDNDGSRTAYFRGRKLRGRKVQVPDGYRGVILNKTGRIIHDKPNLPDETPQDALEDAEEDVDEPGVPEDVIMLDEVAEFDNFIVWGHEAVPDERDTPLIRGVSEWLKFAEAMHACDPDAKPDVSEQI